MKMAAVVYIGSQSGIVISWHRGIGMYLSMKYILRHAAANNYAVIAANALNMEMARAVIGAADEKKAPLIIILGSGAMAKHSAPELIVPMVKKLAAETKSPIALCLDHGKDLGKVTCAIRNGFSSVMIDGSQYNIEENTDITRRVVEMCAPLDIGEEGELGHVGMADNLDGRDESLYTKPEDAKSFAENTGVDCLAVAIGTAHGKYPKGFIPHINFELLKQIKQATGNMPIALHGGSGSGDDNIIKAVASGINKINVATDLQEAAKKGAEDAIASGAAYIEAMQQSELYCKELLKHWIDLSGSAGQADYINYPYVFSALQGDNKNKTKEE